MFRKFLNNKAKIIEITNPERIYVENIRSFFNIPTKFAKFLCDVAVKNGFFEKKIAIECINEDCKRVIKVYEVNDTLPDYIVCETCEIEGKDEYRFSISDYKVVEFYKLAKDENK